MAVAPFRRSRFYYTTYAKNLYLLMHFKILHIEFRAVELDFGNSTLSRVPFYSCKT